MLPRNCISTSREEASPDDVEDLARMISAQLPKGHRIIRERTEIKFGGVGGKVLTAGIERKGRLSAPGNPQDGVYWELDLKVFVRAGKESVTSVTISGFVKEGGDEKEFKEVNLTDLLGTCGAVDQLLEEIFQLLKGEHGDMYPFTNLRTNPR
jgi:hypothetical protein